MKSSSLSKLLLALAALMLAGAGGNVSCNCGGPRNMTQTSSHSQFAVSGPTVWTIGGKQYEIESTYLIVLKEGVQFTINYLCPADLDPHGLSREQATEEALPLMIYAYDNGLYQSTKVTQLGRDSKLMPVSRIGVALIRKKVAGSEGGASLGQSGGYRVALTLDEIRARKETAGASARNEPSPGK